MSSSSDSKPLTNVTQRLTQIKDFLTNTKTASTIPWDPNADRFPTLKDLPSIAGAPAEAAWVWGKDDFLGRINLLTPSRVKSALTSISTGELIPTNLPLHTPSQPAFNRERFEHEIKVLAPGVAYDDIYHLNTQSGTQWDGFRHFAHMASNSFYNNTRGADIEVEGKDAGTGKCSIHHWAEHGIAGRGVLLDYYGYVQRHGIAYDCYDNHAISYSDLVFCGKEQGIDIRPVAQGGDVKIGDILFVRTGWTVAYYARPPEERDALALREHKLGPTDGQRYVGVKQEDAIKDWLHDCYFAAVAGDGPTFESWPSHAEYYLHEYILALWGMPLGEMLDLERLAVKCRERGNWFFFFTSSPANVPGGVSSHVNGIAII